MIFLLLGLSIVVVIAIASFFFGNIHTFMEWLTIAGIGLFVIAAMFSGVLGSGDRIRANPENTSRLIISKNIFLLSLPSIVVSIITYTFIK